MRAAFLRPFSSSRILISAVRSSSAPVLAKSFMACSFQVRRPPPWASIARDPAAGSPQSGRARDRRGITRLHEAQRRKAGTPSPRAQPLPWSVRSAAKLPENREALGGGAAEGAMIGGEEDRKSVV